MLVVAALFAAVFWTNLRRLWLKTNPFTGEANWSHAVLVPVIGLYYLFVHREDLMKAHAREFIWGRFLRPGRVVAAAVMFFFGFALIGLAHQMPGLIASMMKPVGYAAAATCVLVLLLDWSLAIMFLGLAVFVYGIYPGQNDYLKDLGMVITLFGIVLTLCGPGVMKIAWFPIAFLVCAIPWPGLVYSWIAEPLQNMAATVAVDVLKITGVDSLCSGTKIIIYNTPPLPPRVLNVAEACAGMRSLMTFVSVGAAIAFLSPRPLWQKLIIVVSAIPIAIFCNVMRISGQGLLDHYVSPQWSESFAHQFVGMMMLLPAFFLILGVGYVLDKLFIEEAEEGDADFQVQPKAVGAIATREDVIAALGVMPEAAAASPKPSPALIARAAMGVKPASGSPQSPAAGVSKPAVAPRPTLAPAVTPVATSAKPVAPKLNAARPPGAVPPRPVTPANPRPAAPAAGAQRSSTKAPSSSVPPVRMPPPPAGSVLRKSADPKPAAHSPVVPAPDNPGRSSAQPTSKPTDSK